MRVNSVPNAPFLAAAHQALLSQYRVALLNYNQVLAELTAAESHPALPAPAKPVDPVVVKPVVPAPTVQPIAMKVPSAPAMPSTLTPAQVQAWQLLQSQLNAQTASNNALNAQLVSASKGTPAQIQALVQQQQTLQTAINDLMTKFGLLIAAAPPVPADPRHIDIAVSAPVVPKPELPKPGAPVAPAKSEHAVELAKLEKLAQTVEGSKLDPKEKTQLLGEIKALSATLQSATNPQAAASEAKLQKLSEAVAAAVEGAKNQENLAGEFEKRIAVHHRKLDGSKLDAAKKKELLDKIAAILKLANCMAAGEKISCAKAPAGSVESAKDKIAKLEEEIDLAVKDGSVDLAARFEKKLEKLAEKIEASKADAASKAKLKAKIEAFLAKIKAERKPKAEVADEWFSTLSDDVDSGLGH
ncbi:MAG: hypothetical protein ACHQ2Z_10735 [Elusimicrobiota bacterium]